MIHGLNIAFRVSESDRRTDFANQNRSSHLSNKDDNQKRWILSRSSNGGLALSNRLLLESPKTRHSVADQRPASQQNGLLIALCLTVQKCRHRECKQCNQHAYLHAKFLADRAMFKGLKCTWLVERELELGSPVNLVSVTASARQDRPPNGLALLPPSVIR